MYKGWVQQKRLSLKMESLLYLLFLTFIFCSAKSALAVAEEAEKMLDFRCRREVLFHFMDSFVQLQAGTENGAVCFFKPASYFGGDIVSGESYAVQSDHSCRIAVNDHELSLIHI